MAGELDALEKRFRKRIGRIGQRPDSVGRRHYLTNQFDSFGRSLRIQACAAGDISARPREAFDQAGSDHIPAECAQIGISCVACLAAVAAGVNHVTITSTLSCTRSAANSGRRLICPWSDRNSNRTLLLSM